MQKCYCEYSAYTGYSSLIPEREFYRWGIRASRKIDQLTFGRASVYAEALACELEDACAQIADILYQRQGAVAAAVSGLAGASNDGYSESYTAAQDGTKAAERECFRVLEESLGSDPHGLLYGGVV